MTNARGPQPYRKTQVLTSSPAELMVMLYNAGICLCEQARSQLEDGEYETAHALLVKAENVVLELSSGLRQDVYPDLVDNLSRLFEFVFYRLFEGNVSHNPRCIDEAMNVLVVLRDAWMHALEKVGEEASETRRGASADSVEVSA